MTGRPYLSIGDVLTLLRQEFPDVTISKIRFLESQGLVNPERTPSGYRKFYEPDVDRLRWVLRQQREHFLPLKVIKGRLEEGGGRQGNGNAHEASSHPSAGRPAHGPRAVAPASTALRTAPGPAEPLPGLEAPPSPPAARGAESRPAALQETERGRNPRAEPAPASPEPTAAGGGRGRGQGRQSEPAEARAEPAVGRRGRVAPVEAVLDEGDMTAEELAAASACPPAMLQGLESFGLIESRQVGGVGYFGEEALDVARLAAAFAAFGVEPRHLRLHKHAAEREAGFIGQVVLPLLKQRNPESRQRAHDTVAELSRLGQDLRAALLRRALRDQLGG